MKSAAQNQFLPFELAPFVIVAELLALVQLAFQDAAFAQAGDIGRGNVVELADAGAAADRQDLPRALQVGKPGLALPVGGLEGQAGGIVDHRVAMPGDPIQRTGIES